MPQVRGRDTDCEKLTFFLERYRIERYRIERYRI
ncbi:hypothetical protein ANME2D_00752 [Candidatus Methanoperedens nitroreducens]|uniref:Uncharacterized protein n=1 Tax=Candidatus Methanoperedens nitratireducens TaxID=1392998 RepID=A0A062VDD8_9EURY|nr:hypothetical protein ANME2D_00752 [Candidatus Methanoperedens nitroreducens]